MSIFLLLLIVAVDCSLFFTVVCCPYSAALLLSIASHQGCATAPFVERAFKLRDGLVDEAFIGPNDEMQRDRPDPEVDENLINQHM